MLWLILTLYRLFIFSENVKYLLIMKLEIMFFLNGRYKEISLNFCVNNFLTGSLSVQTGTAVATCRVVKKEYWWEAFRNSEMELKVFDL